ERAGGVVAPAGNITGSDFDSAFSPPAFNGLDVAVERFHPQPPPISESPVFALNYGDSVDVVVPAGLNVALNHSPTDPTVTASPIFYGLANALPPGDVLPL